MSLHQPWMTWLLLPLTYLLLFIPSLWSSHNGLLATPQVHGACAHLTRFSMMMPLPGIPFPPDTQLPYLLTPSSFCSEVHLRGSPNHHIQNYNSFYLLIHVPLNILHILYYAYCIFPHYSVSSKKAQIFDFHSLMYST